MQFAMGVAMLASVVGTVQSPTEPAEAIAIANAHFPFPTTGVFHMTVAAAVHAGKTVYLNSSADYRAPDDLTFRLTGSAAKVLQSQSGSNPEIAMIGKNVTVRGYVQTVRIVNDEAGGTSFNRYGHQVVVEKADQLILN